MTPFRTPFTNEMQHLAKVLTWEPPLTTSPPFFPPPRDAGRPEKARECLCHPEPERRICLATFHVYGKDSSGRVRRVPTRLQGGSPRVWGLTELLATSGAPYVRGKAFWPHEMRPYGSRGSPLPLPSPILPLSCRERAGVRGAGLSWHDREDVVPRLTTANVTSMDSR